MKGAGRWARVAAQLRAAPKDIAESFAPVPPPEGLRRPGVFQPELWERLDTEDIKYAAKQATRTWWDDWRVTFGKKPLWRQPADEDAPPTTTHQAEQQGQQQHAQAPPGDAGQQQPQAAPTSPPIFTADEIRDLIVRLGTRAGDAYHDPALRAKGQALAGRAAEATKGLVDEFVAGYAEGKASEIRRALEEEAERQAAAAAAAATVAASPGGGGGAAAAAGAPTPTAASVTGESIPGPAAPAAAVTGSAEGGSSAVSGGSGPGRPAK